MTVNLAELPGLMSPVFCATPFPSTPSACVIVPLFLTSNVYVPVFGTVIVFGVIENSFSESEIVCPVAGVVLVVVGDADGLFDLPPQAARSSTVGTRIQTRRISTSYVRRVRPDSAVL